MQKTFNARLLTLVEAENIYEKFTGRKTGNKYRLEYAYKKGQSESLYHRIAIETSPTHKSNKQLNVEISISCGPLGIFESKKFITDNDPKGSFALTERLVRESFKSLSILEQSV